MENHPKVEISKSLRRWWSGDKRVEKYMPPIDRAIKESGIKWPSQQYTKIYNRSYEAIHQAIKDFSKEETNHPAVGYHLREGE